MLGSPNASLRPRGPCRGQGGGGGRAAGKTGGGGPVDRRCAAERGVRRDEISRPARFVGSIERHRIAALAKSRQRRPGGVGKPVGRRDEFGERHAVTAN